MSFNPRPRRYGTLSRGPVPHDTGPRPFYRAVASSGGAPAASGRGARICAPFRSWGPSGTVAFLMETKTPDFSEARRATRRSGGRQSPRIGRFARRAAAAALVLSLPFAAPSIGGAAPPAGGPVAVKGKLAGAAKLMNPVWNEAKDPNLHRFTFREPSATVPSDVRALTGFLPKELCIAALVARRRQAEQAALRMASSAVARRP